MLWPAPVPSRAPPRSFTTTLAPSRARVMAYSRPNPPPAPVTTMTRSCTPGISFLSSNWLKQLAVNGGSVTGSAPAHRSEHSASQLEGALGVGRVEDFRQIGPSRVGQHRLAV